MKVFLVIVLVFLLTGCFGNESDNGDIENNDYLNIISDEDSIDIDPPVIEGFTFVEEADFPGYLRLIYSGQSSLEEAHEVFTEWALSNDWVLVEKLGYTSAFERSDYVRYLKIASSLDDDFVKVIMSFPLR